MSIANSKQRSSETIAGSWQVDPDRSSVEFRVGNFWGLAAVQGHFGDYHGRLDLSADPAIELTIDAASLDTGNAKRDKHLRSGDFFDAENHPRVQFVSQSVQPQGENVKEINTENNRQTALINVADDTSKVYSPGITSSTSSSVPSSSATRAQSSMLTLSSGVADGPGRSTITRNTCWPPSRFNSTSKISSP